MKITHTLLLLLLALPSTAQQTLWRISSPQTKQASYLFGTIYSNAPNAFNFNDSVLVAFRQSKGFAMETNYDSLLGYLRIAKYEEGTNNPIRSILTKEEYDFADKLVFKKSGEHIEDKAGAFSILSAFQSEVMQLDKKNINEGNSALAMNPTPRENIHKMGFLQR
jgi:hypothetical protein